MNSREYGTVSPGMPADLVIIDYDLMSRDIIDGMVDELDVLLTRATARQVRQLIVDGRQVVKDGHAAAVDLDALEKELLAQAHATGPAMRALRPVMQRSQETLREFYRSGGHLGR